MSKEEWPCYGRVTVAEDEFFRRPHGSLMPHAEVAIVPGSHGGFNRINELNDRIAAFIQAHATGRQAAADSG